MDGNEADRPDDDAHLPPLTPDALAALDATSTDLSSLRDEEIPVPPAVQERMLRVIRGFSTD